MKKAEVVAKAGRFEGWSVGILPIKGGAYSRWSCCSMRVSIVYFLRKQAAWSDSPGHSFEWRTLMHVAGDISSFRERVFKENLQKAGAFIVEVFEQMIREAEYTNTTHVLASAKLQI